MKKYLSAILLANAIADEVDPETEPELEPEVPCSEDYLLERGGQIGIYPVWGSRSIY